MIVWSIRARQFETSLEKELDNDGRGKDVNWWATNGFRSTVARTERQAFEFCSTYVKLPGMQTWYMDDDYEPGDPNSCLHCNWYIGQYELTRVS